MTFGPFARLAHLASRLRRPKPGRPPSPERRPVAPPRPRSGVGDTVLRALYMTLGIAVGGMQGWLLTGDALHVREVAVYGTQLLPTVEVLDALDAQGSHTLLLRQGDLAARLSTLPEVAAAQVEVFAPGVVEVTIHERRPALVWVVGSERWLVDDQGLVLRRADGEWLTLPTVYQAHDQAWARGHQLDPRVVGHALRIAQFVGDGFEPGTRLVYHELAGVVVVGSGWQALFDPGGDLAQQQTALRTLLGRKGIAGDGGAIYDLRFPDRAYVRPLPAGVTAPDRAG